MEASERPQLPLEPPGSGSVRVVEDRIVIEGMTIADQETARVVRERAESGEEPARSVRRAIEIGTRVLDREDTAIEVDYVRREFERLSRAHSETVDERNREAVERIEDGLRRALGGDEGPGALGQALESHSEGLAEQIADTFGEDREGAVQAQIKRMLDERDEEFMRRLSADDDRNPLGPIMSTLRTWARERKDDQDSRDRSSRRRSTSCSAGRRSSPGSIRAERRWRRPRRPGRARGGASRSASIAPSSESPPPGAMPRLTPAASWPRAAARRATRSSSS